MELNVTLALVLQYGLPAVLQMIEIFRKKEITDADIAELRNIKPPSAYLTITVIPEPVPPIPPIPVPVATRPIPPFPSCFWGPKPIDMIGLLMYIDGKGAQMQIWADWIKAHPADLDWVWEEYKKTN